MGYKIGAGVILILLMAWAGSRVFFRSLSSPQAKLTIKDVHLTVEVADTFSARAKGLSGRESLCETCGMLFVFDEARFQNFWMKDMKFPLDMIFIRGFQVVEIWENVPIPAPGEDIPKISSRKPADLVLEVRAGFVKNHRIKIADKIYLDTSKK